MPQNVSSNVLGIIGAIVGGTLGFFLFGWIISQNLVAPFVPGGLLGLGCATLSGHRSMARGIACGVGAVLLGFFADWWYLPFVADSSLSYYVGHVHHMAPIKLLMILAGGVIAYWMGRDDFGIVPIGGKRVSK
jgi:hypothetical protein